MQMREQMTQTFDLDRFVQAQARVIAQIRRELAQGRKTTHWMWFVFPQLAGLGHSATARHYAIASLAEAQSYLAHPVLGPLLAECTALVNAVQDKSAHDIFGSPDDLKFHSSMTLFTRAAPDAAVFTAALAQYFGGIPDVRTLRLLS